MTAAGWAWHGERSWDEARSVRLARTRVRRRGRRGAGRVRRRTAKVLAGGQSLIPVLAMRLAAPAHLVDINRIAGAGHGHVTAAGCHRRRAGPARAGREGRGRRPGAAAAGPGAPPGGPPDHPQPRHHRRFAGARRSRRGDDRRAGAVRWHGDGRVGAGRTGDRAADFFRGPLESALAPDELAVAAFFPALPAGSGTSFVEIARRHGDYALCGVGAIAELDDRRRAPRAALRVPVGVRDPDGAGPDRGLAAGEQDAAERARARRRPGDGHPRQRGLPPAARRGADRSCGAAGDLRGAGRRGVVRRAERTGNTGPGRRRSTARSRRTT